MVPKRQCEGTRHHHGGTDTLIESIEDDYGSESLEARIYYRAPGTMAVKKNLFRFRSVGRIVAFELVKKQFGTTGRTRHPCRALYSIPTLLKKFSWRKSGRFRTAKTGDLTRHFDLYHLSQIGVERQRSIGAFTKKCKARE